ncbi:MAG TPA: SAM-dependent chlorinase/fluorinase [Limnochordales bacterium]
MPKAATVVALLTDFGDSEYVGQMKGVLARLCPRAQVVDLCHTISPQAVREGAWVLWTSYRHFPPGTIFLAVVDPGVGTDRPAVAVQTRRYRWVGPDNGLLYPAVEEDGLVRAVRLPVPPGASPTFHGRDLFAPAAARWACGEPLEALGTELGQPLVPLSFPARAGSGEVVRVDRFGNLVTTLPVPMLPAFAGPPGSPGSGAPQPGEVPERWLLVYFEEERSSSPIRVRLVSTYGRGRPGELVAVVGSSGTLELAVVGGSAAERLAVRPGTLFRVEAASPDGVEGPRPQAPAQGGCGEGGSSHG